MKPGLSYSGSHRLRLVRITVGAVGFLSLFLAGCQLFGGDSTDPMEELRDQVRTTVSDSIRSSAMLASVDSIDHLLIESATFMREAAVQERDLFLDYDSTREDYADFFSAAQIERLSLQKQLLAAHLEFKSHATPGEWEILSRTQAHAVSTKIGDLLGHALESE